MTDPVVEISDDLTSDVIEIADQGQSPVIEISDDAVDVIEVTIELPGIPGVIEILSDTLPDVVEIIPDPAADIIEIIDTSTLPGPRGEPGATGGVTIEFLVEYPMSGHRFVVLNADQKAIYADNSEIAHANKVLGMTTGAVSSGLITIQTGGVIEEPSWDWTLNVPIWLGSSGLMVQAPPSSGFSLIVGFPITINKMFINIHEPIFLI